MARKYDSSRREEAAQRTREAILDAAFKLHGQHITDYDSLAAEANVSIATIRKHFPTREQLFIGCTTWGMRYAVFPDLEQIRAITEPAERTHLLVNQVHRFWDSLFNHIWGTYQDQDDNPVLANLLDEFEVFQQEWVDLALAPWPAEALVSDAEARGVVRGLLSFLTYYALIREGGLAPEQATARITEALLNALRGISKRPRKEAANA